MQPFERLRRLARDSEDDDRWFVTEAAECLAEFGSDPAGLVVACRRLLVHHPAAGVLWWLCARVLTAANPADEAWEAVRLLEADSTARRLGERLPFPHDAPVAVYGWSPVAAAAVAERPDLDVVAVPRPGGETRLRGRLGRGGATVRTVAADELPAARPSHLLVEASATSPGQAVVALGTSELLRTLASAGTTAVLVVGVGRLLPERLLDVLRRRLDGGDPGSHGWELVAVERFQRVAGPNGLRDPDTLARRVDCPVAPELLRID